MKTFSHLFCLRLNYVRGDSSKPRRRSKIFPCQPLRASCSVFVPAGKRLVRWINLFVARGYAYQFDLFKIRKQLRKLFDERLLTSQKQPPFELPEKGRLKLFATP